MNRFWILMMALAATPAGATKFPHRSLESLVQEADVIIRVRVEAVTMSNQLGEPINDPNAMTGPGRGHTITLHGRVLADGVLKNSAELPSTEWLPLLLVRLNQKWHHRLGDVVEEALGEEVIWLLKGTDQQPVYPGLFHRPRTEITAIEALLEKHP